MLYVNHTQLVKVADGEQPSEHPEGDSNQNEPGCELPELYDELQRKHLLLSTFWNSLDTKIEALLGFTVVAIFGVVFSLEIINSIALSAHGVWLLSTSTVTFIVFWFFWFGFALLVGVTFVGLHGLFIRKFEDIDTIDEIKLYMGDESVTLEKFKRTLGLQLYQNIGGYEEREGGKIVKHPGNLKIVKKKALDVTLMIWGFVIGIAFFVIRFVVYFFAVH